MSYTITVEITQELIDRPGVNPNDSKGCLCYAALTEMGYEVIRVAMYNISFNVPIEFGDEGSKITVKRPRYVGLPNEAQNYLAPLIEASGNDSEEESVSWRELAYPFSYQLELPDHIQPAVKQ